MLSLLFEEDWPEIQSGSADSYFNLGIQRLIFSKENGLVTYKELELLRAASANCPVCLFVIEQT